MVEGYLTYLNTNEDASFLPFHHASSFDRQPPMSWTFYDVFFWRDAPDGYRKTFLSAGFGFCYCTLKQYLNRWEANSWGPIRWCKKPVGSGCSNVMSTRFELSSWPQVSTSRPRVSTEGYSLTSTEGTSIVRGCLNPIWYDVRAGSVEANCLWNEVLWNYPLQAWAWGIHATSVQDPTAEHARRL